MDKNNGMMTKVWGPPGWLFLHSVTFGYPIDPNDFDIKNNLEPGTTRNRYTRFFENIGYILPCKYCRDSYQQYIAEYPVRSGNRDELIEWLYVIHNKVNNKLEIKYQDASLKNVKERYEKYRATCNKGKQVGCTIPINGKKLKTRMLVLPDVCLQTILFILSLILYFIYKLVFNKVFKH